MASKKDEKREKIPWEMWQSSRWHGGGAGWVLVELLGQHARFLPSPQAPAGHREPKFVSRKVSQYQAISHSRPRALLLYAQVLTLSVAARR